LIMTVFKIQGL